MEISTRATRTATAILIVCTLLPAAAAVGLVAYQPTTMFDLMASAEPVAKPMLPPMLPIIEDRQGDCRHAIAKAAQMTADAARERLQAIGDCDHNTDCRIVAQADYAAKLIQYEAETGDVCRITNDALDAQLEKREK